MVTKITASTFHELIQREDPVVIKFSANWCGPCKTLTAQLNELNAEVYEVDVDEEPDVAVAMRIRNIPKSLVFKSGEIIKDHTGGFESEKVLKEFLGMS